MGLEEKLPGGILLSTVEKVAGYVRKGSLWPATFGLACCAIEMMATAGPRFDIARFGMERFSATPRQADLMIVAGRVSQKMAPVLRQVYDQMAEPKWVLAMGVCASSGGMFNNYAIVQGVDHVVPVDIYLPGCPPRPEMLLHAILKLHDKIQEMPLGVNREEAIREAEQAALAVTPDHRAQRVAAVSENGSDDGGWQRCPRGDRRAPRHVRGQGQRRHVGLRPSGPPGRAAGQLTAAVRRLLRRGRRHPRRRARRGRLRRSHRAGGGLPRRTDAGGAARAPARGGAGAARRPGAAVRAVPGRRPGCTTPTTPAASCTPSTR